MFFLSMFRRIVLGFLVLAAASASVPGQLEVPLDGGRLSLLRLSRAVLQEFGIPGETLRFPDVRLDLRGIEGALILGGLNQAFGGAVTLRRVDQGRALAVTVDTGQTRALRRRARRRIGQALSLLVGQDVLARTYELGVPRGLAEDGFWALCIHGAGATPKVFGDLRRFLAVDGGKEDPPVLTGTFAYANDDSVERIGRALAARMRAEARLFPKRRVVIISHSMGGLVARSMLETPGLNPGNVVALIMLGTPNQGSRLAVLRPGLDVVEFLRGERRRPQALAALLDELGDGGCDLSPGSAFLTKLNRRPRPPGVAYHLILGTGGVLTRAQFDALREQVVGGMRRLRGVGPIASRADAWLGGLTEVVDGEGDGAVDVRRGRLPGVEPVVLPVTHMGMLAGSATDPTPVFTKVRDWVTAARVKSRQKD